MKRWIAAAALLALPLAAGAVQLRYGFQVGQDLRYREVVSAKGAMTLDGDMGQQSIAIEARVTEDRSLKTVSQADAGSWWIESRSLSGQATTTVQGETMTDNVPGENLRLRMTRTGEVLEVKQLAQRQTGDLSLDLHLEDVLAAIRLSAFPEQDVQAGATWSREVPLATKDGRRLTARSSSTLTRFREAEGRQLAEIQTRYEVPVPPSTGKLKMGEVELPIRIEGLCTGTTTAAWDIARGCSRSTYGTGKVELKLTFPGLAGQPAVTRLDLQTRTNLVQ